MSHKTCCSKYKRPTTVAAFTALCYPSNPAGHSDIKNRIHNPESKFIPIDKAWKKTASYKLRKGWWFRLDTSKITHLLDGSGDAKSRGVVKKSGGVEAKGNARLVCFNACALKKLTPPGGTKPVLHGFTWQVSLGDNMTKAERTARGIKKPSKVSPSSGWIPLDAVKLRDKKKTRPKVLGALRHWTCCVERYKEWGKALTKPGSTKYELRTVKELEAELLRLAKGKVSVTRYFKEASKGGVRKVLVKCNGKRTKLVDAIGIHPHCSRGNKLTDYLPKGRDYKDGSYDDGYTNLSTNVSIGPTGPLMAPIALDLLPAGHTFHRVKLKGDKRILGYIYRVPKGKSGVGKLLGRVSWLYGYCDVESGDPRHEQRRYGWVPALAVKLA